MPEVLRAEVDALSGSRLPDDLSNGLRVEAAPATPMPDEQQHALHTTAAAAALRLVQREHGKETEFGHFGSWSPTEAATPLSPARGRAAPALSAGGGSGGGLAGATYRRVQRFALPTDTADASSDGATDSSIFYIVSGSYLDEPQAPPPLGVFHQAEDPTNWVHADEVLIRQQRVAPDTFALIRALNAALTAAESLSKQKSSRPAAVLRSSTPAFLEVLCDEPEVPLVDRRQLMEERARLVERIASGAVRLTAYVEPLQAVQNLAAEVFLACQHHVTPPCDPNEKTPTTLNIGFDNAVFGLLPSHATAKALRDRLGIRAAISAIDSLAVLPITTLQKCGLLVEAPPSSDAAPRKPSLEETVLGYIYHRGLRRRFLDRLVLGPAERELTGSPWKEAVLISAMCHDPVEAKERYASLALHFALAKSSVASSAAHCFAKKCARRVSAHSLATNILVFAFDKAPMWESVDVDPSASPVLVFDGSDAARVARAEQHLAHLVLKIGPTAMASAVSVVVLGDPHTAGSIAGLVECAAFVVQASLLPAVAGRPLYEIALVSVDGCDAAVQRRTQLAAASVLQLQRDCYIVSTGNVASRLAGALASECCRLAQRVAPAAVQDALREHLPLAKAPFEILDMFGTATLLRVLADPSRAQWDVAMSPVVDALQRMKQDGFFGTESRGGFCEYDVDHEVVGVNSHVFSRYVAPKPSATEIANRVFFAFINEACGILLDDAVASAEDCNMATLAAGFVEASGGALAMADAVGIVDLRLQMIAASKQVGGGHLAPSALLAAMVKNKETFASLTPETVRAARAVQLSNSGALASTGTQQS